jgi:hypothetical protein
VYCLTTQQLIGADERNIWVRVLFFVTAQFKAVRWNLDITKLRRKAMIRKLVSLGLMSIVALMIVIGLNIGNAHSQSTHRGRIQAQGSSPLVEMSQAWAQATPLSAADGLVKLDAVWNSLTTSQQKERAQAYSKAKTLYSKYCPEWWCHGIHKNLKNISGSSKKGSISQDRHRNYYWYCVHTLN